MKTTASVDILSQRETTDNIIIEADVNVRGIQKRKRFALSKNLNNAEIIEKISAEIKEEENRKNVVGNKFEVQV